MSLATVSSLQPFPVTPLVNFGDVLALLPNIPPSRIRMVPTPGTATAADVVRIHAQEKRRYELYSGILVEKAMGAYESLLAFEIAILLGSYVKAHDLGACLGEAGMLELLPGQVRIPDLSFISWAQLPNRIFPSAPTPTLHPDLAIEVLSDSNSDSEMENKLHEYFASGTRLVWYIDARRREATVYRSPTQFKIVTVNESLDGEDILPGFQLQLSEIFRIPRRAGNE